MQALLSIVPVVAVASVATVDNPFSYEYATQTDGSGQAWFKLAAVQDLNQVVVEIRSDDTTFKRELGDLKAGQSSVIRWKQTGARVLYEVNIEAENAQGVATFTTFKPADGPVQIVSLSSAKELREQHRADFEVTFDVSQYSFSAYNPRGEQIANGTGGAVMEGGRIEVRWPEDEALFLVTVRAESEAGRFAEFKLVPWSVEIPHTEITFDSGKADVKGDESPKLDESVAVAMHELAAVEQATAAVGGGVQPKLYIVGYTDTVGSARANARLSKARAKAIASYFRDHGFWAPIYFAGMGEDGQRIQTPDDTDEPRNRRAVYVISANKPEAGGGFPATWTALKGVGRRPEQLPPLPERFVKASNASTTATTTASSDASVQEGPGEEEPSGSGGVSAASVEPPPVASSARGCSVVPRESRPSWLLVWMLVLGLYRRRRG